MSVKVAIEIVTYENHGSAELSALWVVTLKTFSFIFQLYLSIIALFMYINITI